MLIERNLAPALTLIGAAIVLPPVYAAVQGRAPHPSAGLLAFGCIIGAAGIFLATLLGASQERWLPVRIVVGLLLGGLALTFALGAGFFALHAGGASSVLLGVAALLPAVAFGVALVAVCKN